MKQYKIGQKTFEQLLDTAWSYVCSTKRLLKRAREEGWGEEAIELLEWDLRFTNDICDRARAEVGHGWERA